MSHRIVFLDRATIAPQIRVRPPSFAHELIEHAETRADQVVERLAGASIAITNKVPITRRALERLPALKLVAVAATGTDCVDKAACARARRRGEQHPRLCDQHGARAHLRADPRAAPQHRRLSRVGAGRALAGVGAVLLLRPSDPRPARRRASASSARACSASASPSSARAFGMLPMFAAHKGRSGLGPLYTPWQEVLETQRRHHACTRR